MNTSSAMCDRWFPIATDEGYDGRSLQLELKVCITPLNILPLQSLETKDDAFGFLEGATPFRRKPLQGAVTNRKSDRRSTGKGE